MVMSATCDDLGLPSGHPVSILLAERERLLAKQRQCLATVENAKANMIRHRALASQHGDTIRALEESIKVILPKVSADAGKKACEPSDFVRDLKAIQGSMIEAAS